VIPETFKIIAMGTAVFFSTAGDSFEPVVFRQVDSLASKIHLGTRAKPTSTPVEDERVILM